MNLNELTSILKELSAKSNLPEFHTGAMAESIIEQLAVVWDRLSDQARGTFLGIAAMLHRHASEALLAEFAADEAIRKMRGPQ